MLKFHACLAPYKAVVLAREKNSKLEMVGSRLRQVDQRVEATTQQATMLPTACLAPEILVELRYSVALCKHFKEV